ncbi:MAG TPA: tetratricopeptide repeat protein [Pyrinomonadaceae bacterium]|nr:tetratricopeptide repeat protein [Pyrinomonadaceae bacterium]
MKLANNPATGSSRAKLISLIASIILLLGTAVQAQSPQLSLADLLIGLRSKKATLPERNTILTDAVRQRGVTFSMTTEIEKELETTGASPGLIQAIRDKSAKPVVSVLPKPVATPVPTPTPPDFNFYQTRADMNAGKGDFSGALPDYNKSIEMKPDNQVAYLNRGKTHFSLKSYDLSVKDFDRAVELNPKDSTAVFNRGVSYEKLGDAKKAMADFQKAVDLDPSNESAKASLKRLQNAAAEAAAAEAAKNAPPPAPEFVHLGALTNSNALRMVTPTYALTAQRANVEGKVTVEVEMDVEGNVVSAKSTAGPQMLRGSAEDAARRSKFKPGMYNNKPIKSKGTIIYNFSLRAPR